MLGTKILEQTSSEFNKDIKVVKTFGLGTYIQVDGLTQSGGVVESIWKSALKKVKSKKGNVKSVLILGLGGGTAAKLIKKHWDKSEITGVEIDSVMVELGKKYLGLRADKIYIGDAERSIGRTELKYDLILVDIYLGREYPIRFEDSSFLNLVSKLLNKGGIAVFNRLYFGDKRPEATRFGKKLKKVFSKVDYFYPEANLMFICSN